jgi:hypothetical protein
MHQSFVSTTPRRAGNPGEFDNKFFPERRAFDNKLQPHTVAIDKLGLIPRHRFARGFARPPGVVETNDWCIRTLGQRGVGTFLYL